MTVLMVNAFVVSVIANEFIADKMKIADGKGKKIGLMAVTSLVIWLLRKIPVIGSIISIAVFMCGVGIVILYQFDARKIKE